MTQYRHPAWLICYDIADEKRLTRVHKNISGLAAQIQYSVYHLRAEPQQIDQILADLQILIDPREDDIRIYPLARKTPAELRGHGQLEWSILNAGDDDRILYHGPQP